MASDVIRNYCDADSHIVPQFLPADALRSRLFGQKTLGRAFAVMNAMKEPSAKRQRTLALHDRAIRFSAAVNTCCPARFSNVPSKVVWEQLVRAADSTSNNLVEADDASSDADFLNKMSTALKEVKESRAELIKLRLGNLDRYPMTAERELESEAGQLAAIFATIIRNMKLRLEAEHRTGKKGRRS
jgi:four helix bundle protein